MTTQSKVAGVLAVTTFLLTTPTPAAPYTFTPIADTVGAGNFGIFGPSPDVNASGTAAFSASPRGGGAVAIYRANASGFANVANNSGPFSGFGVPSINDAGTVVFNAGLDAGGNGIFSRNGAGPTLTIADSSGPLTGFRFSRINPDGIVAFVAGIDTGGLGVFTGSGGPTTTTIASTAGPFSDFGTQPDINAAGTVAFYADRDTGGAGIYTITNGVTRPITENTSQVVFDDPNINASGTVTFRGPSAIYTGNGGPLTTIANTSGPYAGFQLSSTTPGSNFSTPGISDDGTVVFGARLDAGGVGLFTGPDPIAHRVIATGDPLFGSTLSAIKFFGGVSSNGNIAFGYHLANNVGGIAVATPITPIPGDANSDQIVNHADFQILFANFGKPGNLPMGDFNGDGRISFPDFQILERNFGAATSPNAPAQIVPDPAVITTVPLTLLATRRRNPRPVTAR